MQAQGYTQTAPDVSHFEPIDAAGRAESFKRQTMEHDDNWQRELAHVKVLLDERHHERNLALEAARHYQQLTNRLDREIETLQRIHEQIATTHAVTETDEVPARY